MDAPNVWIAAVAHHLQRRWRTVDPDTLADLAADLACDERLSELPPEAAVDLWLEPVSQPLRRAA
jgi:hypothetical protein